MSREEYVYFRCRRTAPTRVRSAAIGTAPGKSRSRTQAARPTIGMLGPRRTESTTNRAICLVTIVRISHGWAPCVRRAACHVRHADVYSGGMP